MSAPRSGHTRTPFVGRSVELVRLQAGIEAAAAGHGRLVLIVGEPGIGKTRLTEELRPDALRAGMRVLAGRCYEGEGAPPYWPWVQIVRAYAGTRDGRALRAELGAWAPDIARIVPDLHHLLPGLAPPLELDPPQARFRVFDGLTAFLTAAARTQPLVLVLDDLHWADQPSLLLLGFLAGALRDARLLVVATYRDAEVHPEHPLLPTLAELAREPVCERLVLGGLSRQDVARFIELHAGRQPSAELVESVHERGEGNPFFITELVHLLADEHGLGSQPFTIPRGVRAMIARRLNRLSEECNRVLALAAAFGRDFALAPLVRVSDDPAERVLDALDEAVRAGVVALVPGADDRYAFSHALVRESLYDELGAIRRIRLHRRIADTLVELSAHQAEPNLEELAHHCFQAAAGGERASEAIDYAVRAARHALVRLAYEKAAELYALALRGLAQAPDEPRRCRLLLALGDAFARASEVGRAKEAFSQAAGVARQLGDAEAFAAAALGYGGVVVGVGTIDAPLVRLLEESLARLDDRDSRARARVLARLAAELYFASDVERRSLLSEQAVAMARRLNDPTALIHGLEARHFSLWGTGDPAELLGIATEILRLAEELDDRGLVLRAHQYRIADLLELGDLVAVDEAIASYERLAGELRQPAHDWRLRVFQGMRVLMTGRFAEAEELAQGALALGQRVQWQTATNFFGVQIFSLRREQGRLAELESAVRSFVDTFPAVPSWRAALASLLAELGRGHEAREQFDQLAANDFRDLPHDNSRLMGLTLAAEVCASLGDRERAARLYELLLPHATRVVVAGTAAACNGSVARLLGLLAATLGRGEAAGSHFETALQMNRRLGAHPFVARTALEYAGMLLAPEHASPAGHDRARALLDEAVATASALGMQRVQAEAERLLAELAAAAPQPALARAALDPDGSTSAVFRRDGDIWTLGLEGRVCRLQDTRGLRYIALLLRHPHADVSALALVQQVSGVASAAPMAADPALRVVRPGSAGAALDAASRRAYRRRLTQVRSQISQAQTEADAERVAGLQREADFLARELALGVGLGGRPRAIASPDERARTGVRHAIRLALAAIQKSHPAMASHLEQSLRTGTQCCYDPPPDRCIDWQT